MYNSIQFFPKVIYSDKRDLQINGVCKEKESFLVYILNYNG